MRGKEERREHPQKSLVKRSNFIISVGANADSVMTIKFWTMGSLAGTTWSDLVLPTIVVGLAFLFFATQYRVFNAMMMGDEAALTLL